MAYECCKCGSMEINIKYVELKEDEEYLEKKCSRCGYFWNEKCKDHPDNKQKIHKGPSTSGMY